MLSLCHLYPPATCPSQNAIDHALDSALFAAEGYAQNGAISSASNTWRAMATLATLQAPATTPTQKRANTALEKLAEFRQNQIDEEFTDFALNKQWLEVLNYFVQDKEKPSQIALSFACRTAAADKKWAVVIALCDFQQPDTQMASQLIMAAAKDGNQDEGKCFCLLDEQKKPGFSSVKRALNAAKKSVHS
ncbi:MAG: hypothetical protein ACRCXC_00785 [Legionella sp.]